jgi:hypothetical protein
MRHSRRSDRLGFMFEKIVLRRSESGLGLTLGEVAEALLFYQNVHLVLDPQSLGAIAKSLGVRELLALVARGRLSAVYAEDMLMARQDLVGTSIIRHEFLTATVTKTPKDSKGDSRRAHRARLDLILERNDRSRAESKRLADRFLDAIPVRKYSSDYFTPGGVHRAALASLDDADYVTEAIRRMLTYHVGFESFAENLQVEVIRLDSGKFVLNTNIDFDAGNARRDPSLGKLTEGTLVVALLDTTADVNIASLYGGDFHTSTMNSDVVRIRFKELLRRAGISAQQLQQFKDIVLPDYPTIREVINSGERTFQDFEKLLDRSEKFRSAVHKMSPDSNLVEEYFKQVLQEGWISSLPAKGTRYMLCLLLGIKNPIVGAAASAADTFLLDKLKGWRPNHFVDGKLRPFLDV